MIVAPGAAFAAPPPALAGSPPAPAAPPIEGRPALAVASSLRAAWPALEAAWRTSLPGVGARPTFGASLTLARQIARGAPFELLLAADELSLDAIPATRVAAGSRRRYAAGRLVLATRATGAGSRTDDALADLGTRLANETSQRLAIASPVHAPYGLAAREALADAGLWPLEPARLITGENAAQTLQFLLAGAVDAALVPASLVAGAAPPGIDVRPVDPARHAPLVHALVVVDGASDAARALADWFASPAARDALAAAGLDPPP